MATCNPHACNEVTLSLVNNQLIIQTYINPKK